MPLKSIVCALCVNNVIKVALLCHIYDLLIGAIISGMLDMSMKYLIQRAKKLFELSCQ